MDYKFIMTTDEKVADKMITFGFKIASHIGNNYIFINDEKIKFNFESMKNICFTNKMYI